MLFSCTYCIKINKGDVTLNVVKLRFKCFQLILLIFLNISLRGRIPKCEVYANIRLQETEQFQFQSNFTRTQDAKLPHFDLIGQILCFPHRL